MSTKERSQTRPRPEWKERLDQLAATAPPLTEAQRETLCRLLVRPGMGPFKGTALKKRVPNEISTPTRETNQAA